MKALAWRNIMMPWKMEKRAKNQELSLLRKAIEDAVIYGDYNKVRELEEEIVQCLKKLKK